MISAEEKIQQELVEHFPFLSDKIRVQRVRRILCDVPAEQFFPVFDYAVKQMDFSILCALTGLDEGETFGFIYHVSNVPGVVLSLKISIPRDNLVLQTVTDYFFSAEIYERELADLLGVKIVGLKPGKRYPLPDNWPEGQYPLRKGWKKEMLKDNPEAKNA